MDTTLKLAATILTVAMLSACSREEPATPVQAPGTDEVAVSAGKMLADRMLIVDTHIDVPFRLYRNWQDIGQATADGQFDYPRAVAGGLNVPFMSIYIPASVDEEGGAKALADQLIDMVEGMVESHPGKFAIGDSTRAVMEQVEAGKISLALGMENGAPIEGDLANLRYFYDRGIRYITLTHSKSNHISDSSYDENKQWGGLSDFGKTLIAAMNETGMMVDVSHISDEAFDQVIEISSTPVIASHSSARHFVPGFERNMSDDMLVKLARNGGVMQLNIGSNFLSAASRESSQARSELARQYIEANGLEAGSDAAVAATRRIYAENPFARAAMNDVLDHVDHVVKIAGIDHIGIGSDFDGVG
ncbi:MAG: membrane dipeptidase, partial [Pseudomonadales bacterium]